jgi:hypothetical protein
MRVNLKLPMAMLAMATLAATTTTSAQAAGKAAQADTLFRSAMGDLCLDPAEFDMSAPVEHKLKWRWAYQEANEEPQAASLYEIFCSRGAYNFGTGFVMEYPEGVLKPVAFALPNYDVDYIENEEEPYRDVRSIAVKSYEATFELVNARFDPETLTIETYGKWRGIGDASSSEYYEFSDGAFKLTRFRVDASYDGELEPQLDQAIAERN